MKRALEAVARIAVLTSLVRCQLVADFEKGDAAATSGGAKVTGGGSIAVAGNATTRAPLGGDGTMTQSYSPSASTAAAVAGSSGGAVEFSNGVATAAPTAGTGGVAAEATGGSTTSGGTSTSQGGGDVSGSGGLITTIGGTSSTGESGAVRFVGRVDFTDPMKPMFAWSGTGVTARFEGTSVRVHLSGSQYYTVILDGQIKMASALISGVVLLADRLDAGVHTIELYRRTEANSGDVQFLGFEIGTGTLLSPPEPLSRRLEVVGDSITCGYGNEGSDENCTFSPETENHYLSYAAIAARHLNAELHTIAWSGKGVICNYGDDATSCTNPMPTYYDRTLPQNATSQWDITKFQPHAVIVNLGTNDFSTQVDPTKADFEQAYEQFLLHIRSKNPDAYILCTNGPMLTGTDLSNVRTYISNVVKKLNDAGDLRIDSFELAPQDRADGLGCDWHPSLKTHEKMAAQLETALKKALSW